MTDREYTYSKSDPLLDSERREDKAEEEVKIKKIDIPKPIPRETKLDSLPEQFRHKIKGSVFSNSLQQRSEGRDMVMHCYKPKKRATVRPNRFGHMSLSLMKMTPVPNRDKEMPEIQVKLPQRIQRLKKSKGKLRKSRRKRVKSSIEGKKIADFHSSYLNFLDCIQDAVRGKGTFTNNPLYDLSSTYFKPDTDIWLFEHVEHLKRYLEAEFGEDYYNRPEAVIKGLQDDKQHTIPDILVLFLLYNYPLVNKEFFNELAFILNEYLKVIDKHELDINEPESILDVVNVYLLDVIKDLRQKVRDKYGMPRPTIPNTPVSGKEQEKAINRFLKEEDEKYPFLATKLLGSTDIQICRNILVLKNFCNWLNITRFSSKKLDINRPN